MVIWKYELPAGDVVRLDLPKGAKFLDVQPQRDTPCAWFLVDDSQKPEPRAFRVGGTGNPFPDAAMCSYLGTLQLRAGALVFHLFELPL